ncbi:MAG: excisionase family DNA-binding protein [Candidatus Omnitrophica bacterium]|nr:excisionase family DNA-binding protein [Candidatus Omnitrophota bacterium]
MQEVMTAKQIADYLQINKMTLYKRVHLGEIPVVRMGRALRFKKDIIDKWLEVESGWDQGFENLLKRSQRFGKAAGITEQKIQQAVEEIRQERR